MTRQDADHDFRATVSCPPQELAALATAAVVATIESARRYHPVAMSINTAQSNSIRSAGAAVDQVAGHHGHRTGDELQVTPWSAPPQLP
jgi:hypothetical protein